MESFAYNTLYLFSAEDIDAYYFVSKLLSYDMDLLVDDFPDQLSEEYNALNLQSKQNVIIDAQVPHEVAEILLEKDRNDVNNILDNALVVDRLGKLIGIFAMEGSFRFYCSIYCRSHQLQLSIFDIKHL